MRVAIFLGIALAVMTLAVYWQAGNHEFINFDDDAYVYENYNVATGLTETNILWAFTATHQSNWHPITWLSHMLDVQLYGLNPRGHHLTNVFVHTATTLLLFMLLFRLTSTPWQSAFVAALFAIHPLHVESVAWVAERKDVLSAFFWFLTLLLYVEYVRKRGRPWYLLALLAFILGLMSKPMLVTLPVIMLLMDWWPLKRCSFTENISGQPQQRFLDASKVLPLAKEKAPFFVCSLISAVVTIYAQHEGGSIQGIEKISLGQRLENAATAYVKYLVKTIWPSDLSILYPLSPSIPLWQVLGALVVLVAISALVIRTGRRHPYLVVGWLWFLITLLPVIGLIQVGTQAMADRYTYIPLVGLFIAVAWAMPALTNKLRYQRSILALLASLSIMLSAALTWQQLQYWQNSITLYQRAQQVNSSSDLVHYNLGIALAGKGRWNEAIQEYQKALAIDSNFISIYNNLGIALAEQGQLDQAIEQFNKVIAIEPNDISAHYNLGYAFAKKGLYKEAIAEFQKVLQLNPNHYNAKLKLLAALMLQKKAAKPDQEHSSIPQIKSSRQSTQYSETGEARRE